MGIPYVPPPGWAVGYSGKSNHGFAAAIIRINVVSDKAYLEITTAAYGLTGSRYIIQIFRNHEFDTFYKYIAA